MSDTANKGQPSEARHDVRAWRGVAGLFIWPTRPSAFGLPAGRPRCFQHPFVAGGPAPPRPLRSAAGLPVRRQRYLITTHRLRARLGAAPNANFVST